MLNSDISHAFRWLGPMPFLVTTFKTSSASHSAWLPLFLPSSSIWGSSSGIRLRPLSRQMRNGSPAFCLETLDRLDISFFNYDNLSTAWDWSVWQRIWWLLNSCFFLQIKETNRKKMKNLPKIYFCTRSVFVQSNIKSMNQWHWFV